jgi:hypothetical protein
MQKIDRSNILNMCTNMVPSLLYNGYRVFPGSRKRPGRDADPLLVPRSKNRVELYLYSP